MRALTIILLSIVSEEHLTFISLLIPSPDTKPDPPEEPVHPEAGDREQPARVRAGVHQREAVQMSVIQLHVSRNKSEKQLAT